MSTDKPIPEAPDHAKRAADAFHVNELESDTMSAPAAGPARAIVVSGSNHFYLQSQGKDSRYICKSIGDSGEALAEMDEVARRYNAEPALRAALESLLDWQGKVRTADDIREWRKRLSKARTALTLAQGQGEARP